jgi:diguanylate cyclase (GGDEF)-like protein/PAS domain S-box-containing protein
VTIKAKLRYLFVAIVLLFSIGGIIFFAVINRFEKFVDVRIENSKKEAKLAQMIQHKEHEISLATQHFVLATITENSEHLPLAQTSIKNNISKLKALTTNLGEHIEYCRKIYKKDGSEVKQFENIKQQIDIFTNRTSDLISMRSNNGGKDNIIKNYMDNLDQYSSGISTIIQSQYEHSLSEVKEQQNQFKLMLAKSQQALAASMLVIVLLMLGLIYRVTKSMSKPFATLKDHISQLNDKHSTEPFPLLERSDEIGGLARAFKAFSDKKHYAELSLYKSEQQFRSITQSILDAIISADANGNIIFWNEGARKIFGYEENEALHESLTMLMPEKYRPAHTVGLKRVATTDETHVIGKSMELTGLRKNGEQFPLEMTISTWKTDGKRLFSAIIRDITDIKKTRNEIHQRTYFDLLTGLANRDLFRDRLQQSVHQAIRSRKKVGIVLFDLDRFKDINDNLGQTIGDLLLQEVAKRVKNSLRDGDSICRIGGDEFAIIVREIASIDAIVQVVQKLFDLVSEPILIQGHEINITTSSGITMFPDDSGQADSLIRNAEMALMRAKNEGRNNFQFFTEGNY